jgi:hypothetical protein
MAERAGTAPRPRPGSNAKSMPATAAAGKPEAAASRAGPEPSAPRADVTGPERRAARRPSRTASAERMPAKPRKPGPSTVQSGAMPGDGYTGRTGPIGPIGERATATPTASSEPAITAATRPARLSATIIAGPAPSARSTCPSPEPTRIRRAMACPAITSAAMPAISANAASAIQSGSMTLCACASVTEATWYKAVAVCPSWPLISLSTVAAPPVPWSSCSPNQEMPLPVPARSSSRLSAGVSSSKPCWRSISSWTIPLLKSTRPVSRARTLSTGRTRAVPNPGDSDCALV